MFLFTLSYWVASAIALTTTSASRTPYTSRGRCSSSISRAASSKAHGTSLNLSGGFFDNIGRFMNNDDKNDQGKGKKNKSNSKPFQETDVDGNNLTDAEIQAIQDLEEEYLGSTLIFRIRAKSMKMGGLRLWIFLNLMGQLNTPQPKSWKANQTDEKVLEMYYKDTTGAVIIHLHESLGVSVYRFGASPSMDYMMNESTILLGILDELDKIVKEGDIEIEDRLLILEEPGDAIEKARELLSFA